MMMPNEATMEFLHKLKFLNHTELLSYCYYGHDYGSVDFHFPPNSKSLATLQSVLELEPINIPYISIHDTEEHITLTSARNTTPNHIQVLVGIGTLPDTICSLPVRNIL